ncbi:Hypothetical predicted protein [Cloeon dipterum]|uniref:N-acetyltransferase domain-containing protein n=1 Tax=Cloeon dipterum TaxID=197152 RepID=A0A8S1DG84_9INSE|nr:Hypothetical predicted protein [Cloeon dipterum]
MDRDVLLQVSEEDFPQVLNILEKFLPDSIVPFEWISLHQRWRETTPSLKLRIFSPAKSSWKEGILICLSDGLADGDKMYGVMYAPLDKTAALRALVLQTKLIYWERVIHIACLLDRHLPILTEVLKANGFKCTGDYHIPCMLLYMPILKAVECPLPRVPDKVRVGSVDLSHFQTVFDYWSMRDDLEFKPIVKKMITENPSVGIFVTKGDGCSEELASMVLQAEYGAVGLLQTLPSFERRGYASVALAHQTRNLAHAGVTPYAAVLLQNEASIRLFRLAGYEELGVSTWVVFKKLYSDD